MTRVMILLRRVCGRKRAFKMFIGDWLWCTPLPLEGKTCWDGASSSGAGAMFRPRSLRACSGHAGAGERCGRRGVGRCVVAESPRTCALLPGVGAGGLTLLSALWLRAGGQGWWVQALGSNHRARFAHTPWLRTATSGGVQATWGAALPGLPRCPQGKGDEPSPVPQDAIHPFLMQESACKL